MVDATGATAGGGATGWGGLTIRILWLGHYPDYGYDDYSPPYAVQT